MLEFYGDAIVMRHFQQGARTSAKWSSVPIINGDGWVSPPGSDRSIHGAQREGRIDGLKFLCIGDIGCARCNSMSTRSRNSTAK